ncbi:MAG: FAD-dependent oxidoreductase, partial [Vicinamibacteria bacterium]|nr:FAD-dependent oxidoreductase [Vicinamibacteria bacterium]
ESVLKAHLLPGQAVTDIHPGGDPARAEIMVTAFDRKARRPVAYRAQRVIFAAPQFLARHLVRTYRDHAPEFIQAFEYGPWLVANLTLRARPVNRGFSAAWDNVIYESPSLGYVVATHQTGRDHGPTVLTYYHAFCDSDAKASRSILLSEDWAHWAEIILSDLERAHPEIRRLTTRLDIMRWGHAMIRPKTGFIWSAARARAAQTFNGIHFAHTDLSGMALFEEAFYHGLRAAEEVLLATGRAPLERWI